MLKIGHNKFVKLHKVSHICSLGNMARIYCKDGNILLSAYTGHFTVELPSGCTAERVLVYDATVRGVWQASEKREQKILLDLSTLPGGIYLVSVYDHGQIFGEKIVIQH